MDVICFPCESEGCSWSPPTKELINLALEGKIAHGGHPVLRWNIGNIFIRTDPVGNIKADKAKARRRLTGRLRSSWLLTVLFGARMKMSRTCMRARKCWCFDYMYLFRNSITEALLLGGLHITTIPKHPSHWKIKLSTPSIVYWWNSSSTGWIFPLTSALILFIKSNSPSGSSQSESLCMCIHEG